MTDIFIISQHRTGSTLLRNILHAHSDVGMAFDELNLYEPLRKNTLDRLLASEIRSTAQLLDAIRKKRIYGTFWREFSRSGIGEEDLQRELGIVRNPSAEQVLQALLASLRSVNSTGCSGIKYPVHFSRLGLLKTWFPESKIIFLFRDPKAMIASKLNDPATCSRKNRSWLHCFAVHYATLLYFCFEFRQSVVIYQKYRDIVFKLRYEELVSDGPSIVAGLCRFCGIEFEPEMINVSGKRSSYEVSDRNTLSAATLDRYKEVLSVFDQWLIDRLTWRSYRKIQ